MNAQRRLCGSLFASLLVGLAALAITPLAAATTAWSESPAASARHALDFWTPARMRHARPLEAPAPGGGGLAKSSGASAAGEGLEAAASDFAEVADPTAAGVRQNGAIFIAEPGFGAARCSGTSVNAPNLSVVFTAGHCVNEGGRRWFDRNWIFVPGYHDGVRPFGVFAAKWLGSTEAWVSEGSENSDVGAAVVTRNERGQRLGAVVGGYDIAWNLSPKQVFDVHGYPAAPPFDGASQRLCSGTPYLGHDLASFLAQGPLNLAVSCEVTGGASGGGWTIHGDVLNSVTNYGYSDDPTTDFGAYFGAAVRALYKQAAKLR